MSMNSRLIVVVLALAAGVWLGRQIFPTTSTVQSPTTSTAVSTGEATASGRNYVWVVGSSTVFPFTTTVAENFGRRSGFRTPVIESTGTGGGFRLFCDGIGTQYPDANNASRRIKESELERCRNNGVGPLVQVETGYDGIVIASSRSTQSVNFTLSELWLALAARVVVDGSIVDNPYRRWSEIDPRLPAVEIRVLGPPPTSGTRDAFVELAMDRGCASFPEVEALSKNDRRVLCRQLREDGAFIEAGENDNLIVQKLISNPNSYGIMGFSFLDRNLDRLHGAVVEGIAPQFERIADGSYPLSRPLFFYAKLSHIDRIGGLRELLAEYTSQGSWGDEGYLVDKGLIPLPAGMRSQQVFQLRLLGALP